MADPKWTASWHKKRQKLITSTGMIVMTTRKKNKENEIKRRKQAKERLFQEKQPQTVQCQQNRVGQQSPFKTLAERMKGRGEGYVDNESKMKTPVEAQW
eukprot:14047226-Ditylum_brightwellii.AAC.1